MSVESKASAPNSVNEIWEKTILRFQERTGQRLDGLSKGPDDLRKALNAHYTAQENDENFEKAKAIGFKMIHCIQLLGGIAAEGASMVFGPAGLCFNALSFLLNIPKTVHEFHGEINAIFAEVGPALAQFRIYQRMEENTQIDEALRTSIYQVMISFVDLCANCINIHHEGRWKSFKRSAKRVLLDDGSVKGELDNFKKLTQDQLNIQATLTLEVALETNQYVSFIKTTTIEIDTTTKVIKTDVSGLVDAERKRTSDDIRKNHLSTLKTKIGVKDEQIATMVDARENMWKSSVKDSGKWLNDVDEYKQWIDRSSTADSVLVLTGEPGTGKSFLVSAIAQEIKSRNSGTKAERSLVGYYSFFIAGKSNSDRQRPEEAIKSICAQLADQDVVYAKQVSSVCSEPGKDEKYFRDATCQDLWTTLSIGAPAKNTTHYILLDSLGTLNAAELERLVKAIKQIPVVNSEEDKSNRVRILLGGKPSAFQEGKLSSASIKRIDVTRNNDVDINAFIVEELKKADLFQGEDEDSQRRKKMVEERLMKRSHNCYSTIQQDLGKIKDVIASSGTEEDLNRVLQESSTDPEALVRSELQTLEAVLKPREIDEINELLTWVVVGNGYFLLDELAAALFLRFNTVSLQPLEQKITGKYSKIFTLTQGGRSVALSDYVLECVVVERDRPRQSADDPKITATISITNGDVKAVQRFFWDLNHYSFLNGFAFQPGSDLPNSGSRKIQLHKVDAHYDIVRRAFDFFLRPSVDERGKALGKYLMAYISHHLEALYDATGLDELPPADKQYIASHIYDMFNEEDLIEKNWEFCEWVSWYAHDEDMDTFWKWLDDPVATGRLGPRDKRWLAAMKKEKHRNRSLLTPIMILVARNWLQDNKWEPAEACKWISGFLSLGVKPKREETHDDDDGDGDEEKGQKEEGEEQPVEKEEDDGVIYIYSNDSEVEMVIKAEQWCKQILDVSEVDYTWCTRIGMTYVDLGENEAAVERFKQAVTILQAQDPIDKEQLRNVFQALGRYSSDAEISLEYFNQAYKQDEGNVEILYALLKGYVSSEKEDEARPIIQKALTEKIPDTDSTLLISILKVAVGDEDEDDLLDVFKAIFSLISSSPEYWTVLQHELEAAVENARTDNKYDDLAILLFQLGSAMYHLRKEFPEDLTKAAGHWHECLTTVREKVRSEDQKRLAFIEEQALSNLAMFYFDRAIRAQGTDAEENAERLRRVYEEDTVSTGVKYVFASFYTSKGQHDKARDLLRSEIITAFNILCDDDLDNDWEGFIALRNILGHTGDYENAQKAGLMLQTWKFDREVLEMLFAENPSLEVASAQLAEFYERECPHDNTPKGNLRLLLEEAERLSAATESGSEEASIWSEACKILKESDSFDDHFIWCNNCGRRWNYDNGLHVCNYCYGIDICDACWNDLRSDETGKVLICSKFHDWWYAEPWTKDNFLRALKRLVPVKAEDGSEELISSSKWLGNLCEDWGMSKSDWNFE
ncbi:hypothetical protein BJX76DRAFT_302251 [Aspergillus varians]